MYVEFSRVGDRFFKLQFVNHTMSMTMQMQIYGQISPVSLKRFAWSAGGAN